jgi:hypothetical protein
MATLLATTNRTMRLTQLSHHIGFGSLRVAEFRHSVSSPLICGAKLI